MAHDGAVSTPVAEPADWHPSQSFEPTLCDAIAYFCRIEAEEKDRQLRADLIAAGINVPANDQDEDD
jgi:hypothetical protein